MLVPCWESKDSGCLGRSRGSIPRFKACGLMKFERVLGDGLGLRFRVYYDSHMPAMNSMGASAKP